MSTDGAIARADSRSDGLEHVRDVLADHLRRHEGETLRGIRVFQVHRRSFSTTTCIEASTDNGSRRFAVKQAVRHALNAEIVGSDNQAVVEFEVLNRLYPEFAHVPGCSVPRPIAVLPEIEAFVMAFVDGHPLVDDLRYVRRWSNRRRFEALKGHFYHCGLWLRHFQRITGFRTGGAESLAETLNRCDSRLRLIEESNDRRCPRDFRKAVTRFLHGLADKLSREELPLTGRHSDFGPWNIMASPAGVTVFDFYGFRDDLVPVDILKMLVYLEAIRYSPLASGSRIDRLRGAFLAGLGPLPKVPVAAVILCEAMQRIFNMAGTVMATRQRWYRRPGQAACLRAHLRWFLASERTSLLWPGSS